MPLLKSINHATLEVHFKIMWDSPLKCYIPPPLPICCLKIWVFPPFQVCPPFQCIGYLYFGCGDRSPWSYTPPLPPCPHPPITKTLSTHTKHLLDYSFYCYLDQCTVLLVPINVFYVIFIVFCCCYQQNNY